MGWGNQKEPARKPEIQVEFDMDGRTCRTYRVSLEGFEATPQGFGQYLTGIVSEKTDLISGQQIIVQWARVGVIRKWVSAPPPQYGQAPPGHYGQAPPQHYV